MFVYIKNYLYKKMFELIIKILFIINNIANNNK